MPSVSHMVTISENWMDFKVRVSTDISILLLNTKNRVQEELIFIDYQTSKLQCNY